MKQSFADRLRELRDQKRIDDGTIAYYLGIPLKTYLQEVQGRRPFPYEDLRVLEKLFGVKSGKLVEEYMTRGEKPKKSKDASLTPKKKHSSDGNKRIKTYVEREIKRGLEDDEQEDELVTLDQSPPASMPLPSLQLDEDKRRSRNKRSLPSKEITNIIPRDQEITIETIPLCSYDENDSDSIRAALGKVLRACRNKRGLSTKDIATKARACATTWTAYEQGRNFPSQYFPEVLAELFYAKVELFEPFYRSLEQLLNKKKREGVTFKTMWQFIECLLYNNGNVNTTAQQLAIDRTMIPKRLDELFRVEPALEYLLYESLPDDAQMKRRGTFERANRRKLFETLQEQYSPTMTRIDKDIIAQSTGYKNWFSLERALATRKLTIEHLLATPLQEKPTKEYSSEWPRKYSPLEETQ